MSTLPPSTLRWARAAPAALLERRARRPLVWAHRGASADAPENSLAALRRAVEAGADGVEFDVQRCGTGELVVFHDRSLGRCLGVPGFLNETALAELRRLTLDSLDRRAGRAPAGERVPTLDEWLKEAPETLLLNLEAKVDTAADADIGADCARLLVQRGRAKTAILSSFHPLALFQARRAEAALSRAALVDAPRGWTLRLGAGLASGVAAIHPHHALVTRTRVEAWKKAGFFVFPWTVDKESDGLRCLDAGVDGLITNVPALMRPLCERYK